MICPKCQGENGYNHIALCKQCFEDALQGYAEFRRLFVDNNMARDVKQLFGEEEDDAQE